MDHNPTPAATNPSADETAIIGHPGIKLAKTGDPQS
jgi:hypothetical protein